MKDFIVVLSKYVRPYKTYLFGSLFFNLLSAVLNVFSFLSLIPMLQLLFGIDKQIYTQVAWNDPDLSMKDILVNNMYYYTTMLMEQYGAATTLMLIGIFLITTTFLKTGSYFASAAIMVPMRTGIVRDIRNAVYRKIISLPLSFFSCNPVPGSDNIRTIWGTDAGAGSPHLSATLQNMRRNSSGAGSSCQPSCIRSAPSRLHSSAGLPSKLCLTLVYSLQTVLALYLCGVATP